MALNSHSFTALIAAASNSQDFDAVQRWFQQAAASGLFLGLFWFFVLNRASSIQALPALGRKVQRYDQL